MNDNIRRLLRDIPFGTEEYEEVAESTKNFLLNKNRKYEKFVLCTSGLLTQDHSDITQYLRGEKGLDVSTVLDSRLYPNVDLRYVIRAKAEYNLNYLQLLSSVIITDESCRKILLMENMRTDGVPYKLVGGHVEFMGPDYNLTVRNLVESTLHREIEEELGKRVYKAITRSGQIESSDVELVLVGNQSSNRPHDLLHCSFIYHIKVKDIENILSMCEQENLNEKPTIITIHDLSNVRSSWILNVLDRLK